MKILKNLFFITMIIFGLLAVWSGNLDYLPYMLIFLGLAWFINTNPETPKKYDWFGLFPFLAGIIAIIFL